MIILLAALFGLGVASALVPACRALAFRLNCVARPSADRWHKRPTPLLGGVAIVATVFLGTLVFGIAEELAKFLLAGVLIFIVGVTDDLLTLKPATKLIAEIGVASILVFFGFRLEWSASLTLDLLLTMTWIVGVTNAFNLLDNMDGLCAGVALIAGATLLAGAPHASPENLMLAVMSGALGGFLFYNFNPASVFMGDSGSLFLGLMFSALALDSEQGRHTSGLVSVILAPALVLLIPIFDTTLVTVLRLISGRRASQGGRDHSSHRLVAIGLSERRAVLVLWTLAALAGVIAHGMVRDGGASLPAAVLFVIAMVIFAVYLSHVRVYQDADRLLLRSRTLTPFVVGFMYKRRVAEVLLDACLVTVSYYSAYRLRFDGGAIQMYFGNFLASLPIVLGVQMVAFFVVGVYRGVWRHFALIDGVTIAKGVVLRTAALQLVVLVIYQSQSYTHTVFVIYALLVGLLVTVSRASFRLMGEFVQRLGNSSRRAVIYGAGENAALVVRELSDRPKAALKVLGFVDDDPRIARMRVQGYPVLGTYDALITLIEARALDVVVINHVLEDDRLTTLEALCQNQGMTLLRLQVRIEELVSADGPSPAARLRAGLHKAGG